MAEKVLPRRKLIQSVKYKNIFSFVQLMKRKHANIIWGLAILYIIWRMFYWYFLKGFIVPVFYGLVFIAMIVLGVWIYRRQEDKEHKTKKKED